jgi:hypothetical protein
MTFLGGGGGVLAFALQASQLLGRHSYLPILFFAFGIFVIGSHKLFPQAGFKPQSS